jgi:glutamate carboxypeptidase
MPAETAPIHAPSTDEAAVLAQIDAKSMLDRTLAWAAINSGSRNSAGLAAIADALAPVLAALGPVVRVAPTPVEAVDATGTARPLVHGDNLHLRVRPDAPVRVLLTGHMDTVFAVDHPFQACRWLDARTVNGPGTADMKGGIAVMLAALEALEGSPFAHQIGYEVVLNADEEVSSLGSAALLRDAARRCHLGLTYEPALPDGTLAGARKGSGNFAAVVRGTAAHAGREPEKGRNALLAAADLALRLAALVRDGLSVNPAKIDGGGPNNIVPDTAVLRFNLRPASLADQARAEADIAAAVAAVAADHDVAITLDGGFARPPKPMDANQRRLFDLVRDCGGAIGLPVGWRDTGGVCDGNNLAATGLAVVDTMGVRGGAIHSADEFMMTDSLVERAQLSALVLMRVAQSGWKR